MDTLSCLFGILMLCDSVASTLLANRTLNCGESSLTAANHFKNLVSPGYPDKYENNLNCSWTISSPYTNVKLVVTNASLEHSTGCRDDSVRVYNGVQHQLIDTLCGERTPTYILSSSYLRIEFVTNSNGRYRGFEMKYIGQSGKEVCGPTALVAAEYIQYLTSPGYPDGYIGTLGCKWILTAIGFRAAAPLLGSFCGRGKTHFISSGNNLLVRYKTTGNTIKRGFRMSYHSGHFNGHASCGRNLTAVTFTKYLTSPGYPWNYKNNLDCLWIITTAGAKIKLKVTDSHLESSETCTADYVKIYDGTSNETLGTFCGYQTPTYISSSSVVRIAFVTNGGRRYQGFRMEYSGGSFINTQDCGESSLTASKYVQYLISPGHPNEYANDLDCKWIITASNGHNIELTAVYVNIELSSRCQYDAVKVYDGSTTEDTLLGIFCGRQEPSYISSGNTLTITFQTDGNNVERGFRLSYKSGDFEVCRHRDMTSPLSPPAEITSPFYPLEYPNGADCTWSIDTSDSDYVVYIEVTYFDLEYSSDCQADYLQAFDGRYSHGRLLGKWCGTVLPSSRQSSGQYMFIKFHSNDVIMKTGFKLQYSSKIKSNIHNPSTIGAITGGIVAGCVVIFGTACCFSYRAKKRERTQRPTQDDTVRSSTSSSSSQLRVFIIGGENSQDRIPATFLPPPTYSEVLASNQEQAEAPPPPYSSLNLMSGAQCASNVAAISDDLDNISNISSAIHDGRGAVSHSVNAMSDTHGSVISEERGVISDEGGVISDEDGAISDEGGAISDEGGVMSSSCHVSSVSRSCPMLDVTGDIPHTSTDGTLAFSLVKTANNSVTKDIHNDYGAGGVDSAPHHCAIIGVHL